MPDRPALLILAFAVLAATPALGDEMLVTTFPGGYQQPGEAAVSTLIAGGGDDRTVEVALPFEVPYFGALQDRVSVCSNGWLAMGRTTATDADNLALPSATAPNALIAPLWDDLSTGTGSVRSFVLGAAPNRLFVVDWNGVRSFDGRATGLSFQVQLQETTGAIVLAYAPGGDYDALSYSAGIENATGTLAFTAGGAGNGLSGRPGADARFTPVPVAFSGRVLRDRPVADETGLGNGTRTDLPVAGMRVRLVREDTGETAARALTDAAGRFTLQTFGVEPPVTLALDLLAEGEGAQVVGSTGAVYAHRAAGSLAAEPATDLGDLVVDAAVDAVNAPFRRALNIQQARRGGRRVALAAAAWAAANLPPQTQADTVPSLVARWIPGSGSPGGTSYVPAVGAAAATLVVSDAVTNPDPWDDDVLLRVYGQHVLASLSVHPGALPSPRGFAVSTTAEAAWADGFGQWFAAFVKGAPRPLDTRDADTAGGDDLQAPPAAAGGTGFPAAVAGALWDLVDPADEPEDTFEGTLGAAPSTAVEVLGTVDRALDTLPAGATGHDAASFFDAWRTAGPAVDRVATARIFIHHGAFADDAAEPDDLDGEALLAPGVGVRFPARTLSPFNDDRIRLDVPGPAPQRLVIGLTQTTATGLDVELLNTDGVSMAFGSTVGAADRSQLVLDVLFTLQPGTYYVRIGWRDGPAASYDVSLFAPLVVTTANLPAWTVGVPFKQDVGAGGGVPPLTFTTTPGAPGLQVVGGTRLTGTPTLAGDHVVTVRVVDAAAPQNVVVADLPLRVNAALGLPSLVGLPAQRTVAFDLGTGGTDAEWTPVTGSPAPLTLLGGATLRLAGDTGAPRTFEVRAGAADAVGAVLDAGSDAARSRVVVTADLAAADGTAVPSDPFVGYFVDALEGSELDVRLRFRGSGRTPELVGIVDDAGTPVVLDASAIRELGRRLRVRGVTLPRTARYHVLLSRTDFVGTVGIRADVDPPRGTRGQAGILAPDDVVEATFDALAGSVVKTVAQRSPAAADLRPTVTEILAPDGSPLALPTARSRRGGRTSVLRLQVPVDGRYVVRMGGADGTTGPLQFRVRVAAPRRGRLVLD